ncbi:efflux RND transporter permease subunit [Poseidonibacter lekithochrous]|uniref:efflux RND transporter permease subunit n=1 Tax=Poseidonibacter TaxID=2321187 RepID=UPI001C094A3D|nr:MULTISPECIES: efflux RND transporter permease subunit [Poseidonibacter]MBU3014923.1 efflux RND transporter permease subunit [Poseidonibacter lekithochrous]MDO6828221.1 efflux RND transporter permease subunit [Poseidonibacter sp. 1_MG-2023]
MNKAIEYFLKNSRLNYTLLIFILIMGIFAYIKIPKEMFPTVTLDSIQVSGSYSGASADNLNNFAVIEIENQIDTISGIEEIKSTIRNGSFNIEVELQDGVDKQEVKDDISDAVSAAKKYLPSDMTEPTVSSVERQKSLLNVSISSQDRTKAQILDIADTIKAKLYQVSSISEIEIFGDSDLQIDLYLDHKKINMYGLESNLVISALQNFSYIYPVGQIEQVGNHVYLTANNNKFDKELWENTIIKVNDKKVYLKDIADISIDYPTDETISRLNGKTTVSLNVYKNDEGDSIAVANKIQDILEEYEKTSSDLTISVTRDSSGPVGDRIKTIISNITLGLILVGLTMHILISTRLSLIIVMGIPFSFILGLLVIETMGYSLNMISLMAILMSLGIVVDDAIIVSENIQRHLDEGSELDEAVLNGAKEMIAPVLIAAFTTIFAFLPMLLISGEFGILMMLIPIVISVLIFASLIESFIFLPLHAKHILKRKDKMLDWTKAYDFYENILHKVIHYKKTFLVMFFITVPLITYLLISQSRFQMMPDMVSRNVTLSFKLDESKSLEETDVITKRYEEILLKNAKKIFIKNIDATVGRFINIASSSEIIENGFTIALELEDTKEDDFLNKYVNPVLNLSFDFEQASKVRTTNTNESMEQIRELVTPLTKEDKVVEFNVVTSRIGIVKTDIELKLSSDNKTALLAGINTLKTAISEIKGTKDIADDTQLGDAEYKFSLNNYAMNLGLTDKEIASQLTNYFMEKDQGDTFNKDGVINIMTESIYKDSIDELNHFLIAIDNKKVELSQLVDFKIEKNFEKIEKEDGLIQKKVFANVDTKITSANEVIAKLDSTIKKIEKTGVSIGFGGEREKSAQMASDMIKAFMVGLFLIFLTLLINFPSFKSAFIILSVIPFTAFGAILGHTIMGINLNSQSFIGMLGLAGVVINDGIIMLDFLHDTKNRKEFFIKAKQRVRPILITSITTILGLSTLIFFPTGESIMLQPIAISLGFGIAWGTILNLIYVPALYATLFKIKD